MFKPSLSKDLPFIALTKICKGETLIGIRRGRILELRKQNLSQRVIASEIGRSRIVTENFLKDPDEYGMKKHTDRPKTISLVLGRRIRREGRKGSSQSSNQFKAHTDAQEQLDDISGE